MPKNNHVSEISEAACNTSEFGNALHREWELISSLRSTVLDGLEKRAKSAGDHYILTTIEVVGSAAAGAALAAGFEIGGKYALASTVVGTVFSIGATIDIGRRLVPFYDVWKNPDHLELDKKVLGYNIGSALFDYPVIVASGGLGVAAEATISKKFFAPKPIENTNYIHSFDGLRDELVHNGFTEADLLSAIKEKNVLGEGVTSKVYKIPGIDHYVLRAPHNYDAEFNARYNDRFDTNSLKMIVDPLSGVNVGQPVAKMGDVTVLKKQDGTPAGAPEDYLREDMSEKAANKYYINNLKLAADMPQSAYDDLAKTLIMLEKNDLAFDPYRASNVLIDAKRQRFNVVDIDYLKIHGSSELQRSVTDITGTLMDDHFAKSFIVKPSITPLYQTILTKALTAGENTGLKMHTEYHKWRIQNAFELAQMQMPKPTLPT